jgi:seryl-tRNA synthetase
MEKAEIRKEVRIKQSENYELLDTIKTKIRHRIEAEYEDETNALRKENETLHAEYKTFEAEAQKILASVTPATKLRVKTQVGKGSSIVNEYVGHIESAFKFRDTCFNFISPEKNEGKPFTIGLSCLMAVEVIL